MARSILDILTAKEIIDITIALKIRKEAKEKHVPLDDILYSHGITETDVANAKSELTGYPVKTLAGESVPIELLHEIPEESARYYKIVPLAKEGGFLDIGILNPDDITMQDAIKFISARIDMPVRVFIIMPSDLDSVFKQYQSLSGEVTKALGEFEREREALGEGVKIKTEESAKFLDEAPVIKMFSVTLRHAVEGKASDIHIEPEREKLRIRFRVDGVLHTSLTLPKQVHSALVTRIKVMSNLKIDETRIPQDGRFHAEIMERPIDFRISTLPTSFGEKVVIRILDPEAGIKSLEDLGVTGTNLEKINAAIERPYGLLLITGPTGSGKSTTLYALLQILNEEGVNIVSLEDPIEYYVAGVNQSQIRPEIGYDFASGLRHILRQDPDIILVGEIRDKETASLAIHAALTGHLVLSTLHTNNAIGVIPRLIDMGVDPFLIAPTLILTMAQRLARKLCPDSRKGVEITGRPKEIITAEIEKMPPIIRDQVRKQMPAEIYQPGISGICPKGTRGRIGLFEVLTMTPELEKIILTSPAESKIAEEAKRQLMITMKQDGLLKVLEGTIGLGELLEVI